MIETCKYCASQRRTCDECHGPVVSRTITEFIPSEPYKVHATFLLCTNMDCKEYAKFNREHAEYAKSYVCPSESCQAQAKLYNPDVFVERTHTDI